MCLRAYVNHWMLATIVLLAGVQQTSAQGQTGVTLAGDTGTLIRTLCARS